MKPNFDKRISKSLAEYLLVNDLIDDINMSLMCKEYADSQGVSDWVGLTKEDLNEHAKLDDDYQTFELWATDWKLKVRNYKDRQI